MRNLVAICFAMLAVCGVAGCGKLQPSAQSGPVESLGQVRMSEIYGAFETNEVAAKEKYIGKAITIVCVIRSITQENNVAVLDISENPVTIVVEMSNSQSSEVLKLKRGQIVLMKAVVKDVSARNMFKRRLQFDSGEILDQNPTIASLKKKGLLPIFALIRKEIDGKNLQSVSELLGKPLREYKTQVDHRAYFKIRLASDLGVEQIANIGFEKMIASGDNSWVMSPEHYRNEFP
jgi:hypothetical protein